MKGVILAGGTGSRLFPATLVTNKHLLQVAGIPMIEYPLATLTRMGINDITIVSGKGLESSGSIMSYLGSGKDRGLRFHYEVQDRAGGIAEALDLVQQSVRGNKIAVVLGDNIFEEDFSQYSTKFESGNGGSMLFLKQVYDPCRFGVAELSGDKIINIEEKPKAPKSDLAVTGLYLYDETVFDRIKNVVNTVGYSARGELEITDVNNLYVKDGSATFAKLNGFWSDAGKQESLEHTIKYIYSNSKNFAFRDALLAQYKNSY
jgi:glucose-1-phosphate thymidylyltransferase